MPSGPTFKDSQTWEELGGGEWREEGSQIRGQPQADAASVLQRASD